LTIHCSGSTSDRTGPCRQRHDGHREPGLTLAHCSLRAAERPTEYHLVAVHKLVRMAAMSSSLLARLYWHDTTVRRDRQHGGQRLCPRRVDQKRLTQQDGTVVTENLNLPRPAPELKRLDRFVGRWSMEGHLVGSDETTIRGEATYRWLPGGFFLEQHVQLDFMGLNIDSRELIGYDPETDTFPSTVFSNLSPVPLPYQWDVRGDAVTITVSYAPLDATFTGSWREDGTFSGGWRPNPGADETANVPYDIGGHRLQ
jgi:hypothetical protein